jgi:hypothetical protein
MTRFEGKIVMGWVVLDCVVDFQTARAQRRTYHRRSRCRSGGGAGGRLANAIGITRCSLLKGRSAPTRVARFGRIDVIVIAADV